MAAFDAEARDRLSRTVWSQVSGSWYKIAGGRITNNWFGSTFEYWRRTRRLDLAAYELG